MNIYLANGMVIPLKQGCSYSVVSSSEGITNEVIQTLNPLEDDYLLITPDILKEYLPSVSGVNFKSIEGMNVCNNFYIAYPEHKEIFPLLKKYLQEEWLTEKEVESLSSFLYEKELPFHPDRLIRQLVNLLKFSNYQQYYNNLKFHDLCYLSLIKSTNLFSEDEELYLPLKEKEQIDKFIKNLDITYRIEEDKIIFNRLIKSLIEYFFIVCLPEKSLTYITYFFDKISIYFNEEKDSFLYVNSIASKIILCLSLNVSFYKRPIEDNFLLLYRHRNMIDSYRTHCLYAVSLKEDSSDLYQDFLIDEDSNLFVRVVKVE